MIGRGLLEFAEHVRPTSREGNGIVATRASLVRLERVAHDDAFVAAHQRLERVGSLVVANAMHDGIRSCQTPHLPGLVALAVERRPARLVESDDRLREHPCQQRSRRRFEPSTEHAQLIPEGL